MKQCQISLKKDFGSLKNIPFFPSFPLVLDGPRWSRVKALVSILDGPWSRYQPSIPITECRPSIPNHTYARELQSVDLLSQSHVPA
jgi:hypothetical protein